MKDLDSPSASSGNSRGNAHIAAVAAVTAPYVMGQSQAKGFIFKHYSNRLNARSLRIMGKVFDHPSIRYRNFAFEDPESIFDEDPDSRISRFTHWAVELSAASVSKALAQAGLKPGDVSALVVNTCTGYICPGISSYLIERLGLSRRVEAYDLVGSGCGGAVSNIRLAESLLTGPHGIVVSVSVEICSATFQMGDDVSLIVSNALFGDGAAAAVLWMRPKGFQLVASSSYHAPEHRDAIRYIHKNGQLYNQLSPRLPLLVKEAVSQLVHDVLAKHSLDVKDVRHWALHTGGDKILCAIADDIGLSELQMHASRQVLSRYGNMSSPSVLFAFREILQNGVEQGDWCMLVAFGAGLSAHGFLLKME